MSIILSIDGYQRWGVLATELYNYDIEVVVPESETLKEVLCPAKQDSMLQGMGRIWNWR